MNSTKLSTRLTLTLICILAGLTQASAGEWMTYRSTYTHDAFGQRVDQHTRPVEPLSPDQGNLVRSGYRHYRSTIQGSTSADNLHITHEWGRPVMPYEHWRFPFRPYGAPYDQWGPPVPNVLSNFNYQGNTIPGNNFPGNGWGGVPGGNMGPGGNTGPVGNGFYPVVPQTAPGGYPGNGYPGNGYPSAPWIDGLYPSAPPLR